MSKIKDSISSVTKNSDDINQKYMKIKFDLDDELPLNKAIEIHSMTTVVRGVFMKITNIIFLDECLYKL